ncbi:cytochrome P450 [Schizophyllum amplum]|uniref:Cytochrome P450 n=1 Tax=Schizophyllum amplum TaxID=97359 RepID=A0A550CEF5_9AGAR|nr:cytochrome P450 [Auriculariopsis ampla]
MSSTSSVASALAVACAVGAVVFLHKSDSFRPPYPPGPWRKPFIGNLLDMPRQDPEVSFADWGQQYGDVVHLEIFGKHIIVLNSLEAARDLMDKRSGIYSDRPRFVMLCDLMGWANATTHVHYGPRFRKHRRFVQQILNQNAIASFQNLESRQTAIALGNFLKTPDNFADHITSFAAGTMLKVAYGYDVEAVNDPYVQIVEQAATLTVQIGNSYPISNLVEFFPWLKNLPLWAPLSGFRQQAEVVRQAVDKMMNVPFEAVKQQMSSGTNQPSFTAHLLEQYSSAGKGTISQDDEDDIKGAAGTLFAAAEDTTTCMIKVFIFAMLLHPEVYSKVQEEIARVVGHDRLPNFGDQSSMPYFDCVLKECFRWDTPVPLAIPHRLMQDDFYKGYFIPEGAYIMPNIYAMMHNCENPSEFCPERYLENPELVDPRDVVFGFGRSPGRHLASAAMWLLTSRIAAVFHIEKARDPDSGEEITPPVEFSTGFVRHPKPFFCSIKPRSEKAVRLVENALAETQAA